MNCEQFKLKLPYPKDDDFKHITFGKEGLVMRKFNASGFFERFQADPELAGLEIAKLLRPGYDIEEICAFMKRYGYIVQVDENTEGYQDAVAAYEGAKRVMSARFKEALLLELNLTGLPDDFVQRVWEDAYDRGHSTGYERIAFIAKEIVYLAQPLIDAYRLK